MKNEVVGKAKGGIARSDALSPNQRREIAKKAAIARWGLCATHTGNFRTEFGIDVDCYVLNDSAKTAVISQRGMAGALGYTGNNGFNFIRLAQQKTLQPYIGTELMEKIKNPFIFRMVGVVPNTAQEKKIHGYDVSILIDICAAIIAAKNDGKLRTMQANIAKQAQIILNASAKTGIKALVYALSGYRPMVEEVIAAFKAYVQAEAKKYEKEFPRELYEEWQRLYDIKPPQKGKNWKFMHLTIDHVYFPLAKSNGKLLSLLREAKDFHGNKNIKLFQFLNEIGTRALRLQIGRVLGIAETSANRECYQQKINDAFGLQMQYNLFPTYPIEQ